jgi:hypothetical protein
MGIFIVDMILKFKTGYYNFGIMVLNRKQIFKNTLKSNFFFNFCSILGLIFLQKSYEDNKDFNFVYRILALLVFLKIQNLGKILEEID